MSGAGAELAQYIQNYIKINEMRRGSLRLRRLHHAGVSGRLAPAGADQAKALADSAQN